MLARIIFLALILSVNHAFAAEVEPLNKKQSDSKGLKRKFIVTRDEVYIGFFSAPSKSVDMSAAKRQKTHEFCDEVQDSTPQEASSTSVESPHDKEFTPSGNQFAANSTVEPEMSEKQKRNNTVNKIATLLEQNDKNAQDLFCKYALSDKPTDRFTAASALKKWAQRSKNSKECFDLFASKISTNMHKTLAQALFFGLSKNHNWAKELSRKYYLSPSKFERAVVSLAFSNALSKNNQWVEEECTYMKASFNSNIVEVLANIAIHLIKMGKSEKGLDILLPGYLSLLSIEQILWIIEGHRLMENVDNYSENSKERKFFEFIIALGNGK